ncbi:uncharacterized protein LOC135223965 [Macrobrachium nipponense]|uniref:uncharacterized protein LOC135223965 n=1 Tax=Macrobrachium nipponense TaxID=159736 RepID=UPI0030C89951
MKNSEEYKSYILCQNSDLPMTSYDVESLFTNVPVAETVEVILDKIFIEPSDTFLISYDRCHFKKLLELAVLDTAFILNDCLYKQVDGMAMGSPLGPTFSNIFMCSLEEKVLENCPLNVYPLVYKSFVDDTFVLFKSAFHLHQFHFYINEMLPNVKFILEKEENGQLPVLDLLVSRHNVSFNSSVFRKKTYWSGFKSLCACF